MHKRCIKVNNLKNSNQRFLALSREFPFFRVVEGVHGIDDCFLSVIKDFTYIFHRLCRTFNTSFYFFILIHEWQYLNQTPEVILLIYGWSESVNKS